MKILIVWLFCSFVGLFFFPRQLFGRNKHSVRKCSFVILNNLNIIFHVCHMRNHHFMKLLRILQYLLFHMTTIMTNSYWMLLIIFLKYFEDSVFFYTFFISWKCFDFTNFFFSTLSSVFFLFAKKAFDFAQWRF